LDNLLDNYIILRLQLDNNIKKFGLLNSARTLATLVMR